MSQVIPFSIALRSGDIRSSRGVNTIGQSIVAQLEAYWTDQRKGSLVPARADINPRGIEQVLPYAFVVERVAPGIARFRIAGEHICDLMGMDVRGMPITTLIEPAGRPELVTVLEDVFKKPATARLGLTSQRSIARPKIDASLVFFPLTDNTGEINRALGCLVSENRIGRTPRRFAINGSQVDEIGAQRPMTYQNGTHLRLVSSRD